MPVEDFLFLLSPREVGLMQAKLENPAYAGKRIIMSSDDLTGEETPEELEGIVSLRELVFG